MAKLFGNKNKSSEEKSDKKAEETAEKNEAIDGPPTLNETEKESTEEKAEEVSETKEEEKENIPVESKSEELDENRPKPGDDDYTEAHRLEDESNAILEKEGQAARDYSYNKKKGEPSWDELTPSVRQLYIDKVK